MNHDEARWHRAFRDALDVARRYSVENVDFITGALLAGGDADDFYLAAAASAAAVARIRRRPAAARAEAARTGRLEIQLHGAWRPRRAQRPPHRRAAEWRAAVAH